MNPRRSNIWNALTISALAAAVAPNAWAQESEETGDVEVDPSLEVGMDWNSNLYNQETDGISGISFRLRPKLGLGVESSYIVMNFGAAYELRKFINANLTNLDNFQDVDVSLNLDALPLAVVGFKSSNSVTIENRSTELTSADSSLLTHFKAGSKDSLSIHPGPSFTANLGGSVWADTYSGPLGATTTGNPRINSKLTYGPHFETAWTFLPRTAFVVNAGASWFDWEENLINTDGNKDPSRENTGDVLAIPDGFQWSGEAGIQGRFTNQLVLSLLAGYGTIDYNDDSVLQDDLAAENQNELDTAVFGADLTGLDGLLAVAELSWSPLDTQNVIIGYNKAFRDSWFTNYVAYHSAFARYRGVYAGRLGISLEGGYRLESFVGEVTRKDHVLRGSADVAYNVVDWFNGGINVNWNRRASADENPLSEVEYDTIMIGAQATFIY